jgi:hypothetical protein
MSSERGMGPLRSTSSRWVSDPNNLLSLTVNNPRL